jgi:hypothetical protein
MATETATGNVIVLHCAVPSHHSKTPKAQQRSEDNSLHVTLVLHLSLLYRLQVSISLILTFMLLWDWPNIKNGVTSLKDSRLQGIYIEVAPSTMVRSSWLGGAVPTV